LTIKNIRNFSAEIKFCFFIIFTKFFEDLKHEIHPRNNSQFFTAKFGKLIDKRLKIFLLGGGYMFGSRVLDNLRF
jgi:hypothetical protein